MDELLTMIYLKAEIEEEMYEEGDNFKLFEEVDTSREKFSQRDVEKAQVEMCSCLACTNLRAAKGVGIN